MPEFQDILPDQDNGITIAGASSVVAGDLAVGFKSVRLESEAPVMKSRTNSGRLLTRMASYHKWVINITYNKLTEAQFLPIYTFLMQKQGSLTPFYVSLPQYRKSTGVDLALNSAPLVESSSINVIETGTLTVLPGDLFQVSDPDNSLHTKTYMVTRVETNADWVSSQPSFGTSILHCSPQLQHSTSIGATIIFSNPLIRVTNKSDKQRYSLSESGLYTMSIALEEAQR